MRTLGSTGLPVTPVGVGLAAVGRPAYITLGRGEDLGPNRGVDDLRRRAHELLDAAYDAGVRYLDAARSYGRAEEFLAQWLQRRGLEPGAVTVGSEVLAAAQRDVGGPAQRRQPDPDGRDR